MSDSKRITRGIPHNHQFFGDFPSYDLCITQQMMENVGSAAKIHGSTSKSSNDSTQMVNPPNKHVVEDEIDEEEMVDEEENDFFVKNLPGKAPHMRCIITAQTKDNLSKTLPDHVYKVFCESTCFGHFMGMYKCTAQAQILRCLMALELNCSSTESFTIRVNGTILRFTLRDFALVTGLNCVGDEEEFKFETKEPNRLMVEYFKKPNSIRKIDLIQCFNQKVWGDNDEDALKFAILYFIHTFIYSGDKLLKKIDRIHFDLVETGRYKDYPWGKKAFKRLTKSICKKYSEQQFYGIDGMPIALQVWIYECSSTSDIKFARKVDDRIPRLLNWETTDGKPRFKNLMKIIFSDSNNMVIN